MIEKTEGTVRWLEFLLLQEQPLDHRIFLRRGGAGTPPFDSLNISNSVGDDPRSVEENRKRILEILPFDCLTLGMQVHGADVVEVSDPSPIKAPCDALITKERGIALTVLHADCQAAIVYDPLLRLVGNIHCGWRGSVQNIYEKTVAKFKSLGSDPSNLLVCVSPSLGPEKAEFTHFEKELPPLFREFQVRDCLFDFWAITKMQLQKAGVLAHHIEIAGRCTYQNQEDYFSHRRDGCTGRHATVVGLL